MSHRLERAFENGAWMFALALLLLSAWGFGRGVCLMRQQLHNQAAMNHQIAQLEGHALTVERSLLGLMHTESPKTRYAGYDAEALFRNLSDAHRAANQCVAAIEAQATTEVSLETYTALARLQAVWSRVDAALGEYLQRGQPDQLSLTASRAFSFEGQKSLPAAVRDFHEAYQRELHRDSQRTLWELLGYFVMQLVSAGVVMGLLWRRWGAPARWLHRALENPETLHLCARRLQNTEWKVIAERLHFQEQRLQEVEQFVRDLAMGRTPAPITPTDAADPLARSSEWLLKRIEQLQEAAQRARAS
ncbi:MAG: hypothetical protein WHS44_00650 [Fimbriimonadales bacterium]|nr:MAG: hypothetical protein KatS3mg018_0821 [Fimbriimonadales bacterium]